MECSGSLEFAFPSAKEAGEALRALGKGSGGERCGGEVSVEGRKLRIGIRARDSVALRAHLNSYLRQIKVIEGVSGVWNERKGRHGKGHRKAAEL